MARNRRVFDGGNFHYGYFAFFFLSKVFSRVTLMDLKNMGSKIGGDCQHLEGGAPSNKCGGVSMFGGGNTK